MTPGKLLWLGWDAADWGVMRPLLDAGELPNLREMMRRGARGQMHADPPLLSQGLWTSQASGVGALEHGVLGPMALRPDRSGLWPTDRSCCRVPRVWEYAAAAGKPSIVVNFAATHPAAAPPGSSIAQISNLFASAGRADDLAGAVWPREILAPLKSLRIEAADIDDAVLRQFIPRLDDIDRTADARPAILAGILANVITVHAATTWLLEHTIWQFAAALYTGLHQACHAFMAYHALRRGTVSAEDGLLYGDVVSEMLRFHDLMLGRLIALAGSGAHILLTSDHGFASGKDRPRLPAQNDYDLQAWHRLEGVVVLDGPEIVAGPLAQPARTLDVAPNLLILLGIKPPPMMHGRVWTEAFSSPPLIASPSVERAANPAIETSSAERYLLDLGYKHQEDPGAADLERRISAENDYAAALYLLEANRCIEAADLLENCIRVMPQHRHFHIALARAAADAQRWDRCGAAIELLQRLNPESGLARAARGWWELAQHRQPVAAQWLDLAASAGDVSAPLLVDIAEGFLKMRNIRRAGELLVRAEGLDPACVHLAAARAYHALLAGNGELAWQQAKAAVESRGALPEHWRRLAEACLLRGDRKGACHAFEKAVAVQPQFTAAWRRLAQLYDELDEPEKAHDAASQAHTSHIRGGGKQRSLMAGFGRVLQALGPLPPPCR